MKGSGAMEVTMKEEKSVATIRDEESCKEAATDDKLESIKAQMKKVIEENERLRAMLKQMEKDYKTLQMHFFEVVHRKSKRNLNSSLSHEEHDESEIVSLSLGRSAGEATKDFKIMDRSSKDEQLDAEGLTLGLDSKFHVSKRKQTEAMFDLGPENSFEESKEEEAKEMRPPIETLKVSKNGENEGQEQSLVKRARVSVRTRCDAPTMNDGCQWRKYGQKIAKGNPCPRAYYRCTVAPTCPVRKQVQRCVDDMSILITTYEGNHNHPLPNSATAMASSTSAAATMLLSNSLTTTNIHGVNFSLSDSNPKAIQSLSPNYSNAHPTITLDLTSSSPSTQQNKFSSVFPSNTNFLSTNLSFAPSQTNIVPAIWGNGYLNFGTMPHNKTYSGLMNVKTEPKEDLYQPLIEKNQQCSQQFLIETLTKAITTDQSFLSVVAAAISSMVSNGGETHINLCGGEISNTQKQPPLPLPTSKSTSFPAADDKDQIS